MVRPLASFLIFDGFELDGSGGVQDAALASNPLTDPHSPGHAEGEPGTVGGSQGHHIGVFNMHVHDFGGGGINLNQNDYFTIWKNVVHDTSKTSPYQESGISVWQPHAIYDYKPTGAYDDEKFHIKILNNISYDNYITDAVKEDHSDGNGIIIDAWKHEQSPPFDIYPYEGLVQGNLVYANGAKGIQVAFSANVTLANNTAIGNNRDRLCSTTWRGEINVDLSDNVQVINNVMLATPDLSHPRLKYNTATFEGATTRNNANVIWKNNLTFNTANNDLPFKADAPTGTKRIIADFQSANSAQWCRSKSAVGRRERVQDRLSAARLPNPWRRRQYAGLSPSQPIWRRAPVSSKHWSMVTASVGRSRSLSCFGFPNSVREIVLRGIDSNRAGSLISERA